MLATEHREPHVSHCKKKRRVSFCRMVSGERHVWHVTYSLMYRLRTFSICFCWNLPLIISWLFPSTEPLVPSSASKKSSRCLGCRCNLQVKRTTFRLMPLKNVYAEVYAEHEIITYNNQIALYSQFEEPITFRTKINYGYRLEHKK